VKRGKFENARRSVAIQPENSEFVEAELAEIVANAEYEQIRHQEGYFSSWANCASGSLWEAKSNLRRTILGTSLQMIQQWRGGQLHLLPLVIP